MFSPTTLERVWTEEQPQEGFTRVQRMSTDITSRATSPSSLVSFRFGARSDSPHSRAERGDSKPGLSSMRRASTRSIHRDKGKGPWDGKVSVESSTSPTSTSSRFGGNSTSSSRYHAPSSFISYEISRPSTADGPPAGTKKPRGNLLGAASDALSSRFGRKRQFSRQSPMPIILPDVIEISAPRQDEEVEERGRLRDMAAQSIGLPATMHPDTQSINESAEAEEEGEEIVGNSVLSNAEAKNSDTGIMRWGSMPNVATKSPHGSNLSIVIPTPAFPNRLRSGSVLAHSRSNSSTAVPVPTFPTNVTALAQSKQAATTLHKYYPPSSLRIFALSSKNWKSRHMMLSSSTTLVARGSSPQASYLHLFKSSNGDEKEIERLEINEDSVVFVAEADVGGRKHVVKVGGIDVGALKKELNCEEGGRTMWFLHIADPAEAQKWITIIKTAILGQRTIRAGLGLPANTLGGIEPRGDMDVMLSMRAQGFITSPSSRQFHTPPQSPITSEQHYAPSVSSQATASKPVSSGPVSALKGLFSGSTRPRSASRAATIASEQSQYERMPPDESYGIAGSQLSNVRTGNLSSNPLATPIIAYSDIPLSDSIVPPDNHLEGNILTERLSSRTSQGSTGVLRDRANKALSLGALSLQPPPRKRWTSTTTTSSTDTTVYRHVNGNSTDLSNRALEKETEQPAYLNTADLAPSTSGQRPRASSIQSVSTLGSGDITFNTERSSTSTKQSSIKRWSRQGVLPRRLTPPSGPPPSIPSSQPGSSRTLPHPYARTRSSSQASSVRSTTSEKSVISNLPSFSKRASGSSALSFTTSNSSQSNSSHPTSVHINRSSIPPPRPAPTFSLPPAPEQDVPHSDPGPMSKQSFRDSVTNRAFRLSMIAPKPPPSSVLPPRPDEPDVRSHRRNSSTGSYTHPPRSEPPSTIPQALTVSPFPPPLRPLPPTPLSTPPISSTPPPRPISRTSIKQRLRILSAPSPSAQATSDPSNGYLSAAPSSTAPTGRISPSSLATPIAQRIMSYSNEPSFLQIHAPVASFLPPPRSLPTPPEQLPELTSLSPPPRRGSKHVVLEPEDSVAEDEKSPIEGEQKPMSLSRPGSVISLTIVSM